LRKNALDCLTKIGPLDETDIPALGSMLKSHHPEVRSRAVVELGKQGNKAVKLVVLALKDKETAIRLLAAAALGGIKGKEAALALTEALPKEEEAEVRDEIVLALGKVGPEAKGAIPHLSKVLLSERDSKSRQKIAMVLGKMGSVAKAAVPSL